MSSLEDVAKEYAEYIKIDSKDEFKDIMDTTDEMLTRLEEFDSLIQMVKQSNTIGLYNTVPQIIKMKEQLELFGSRVDNLGAFVDDLEQNVEALEGQVTEAEGELCNSAMIKTLFKKPLNFSGGVAKPTTSTACAKPYVPVEIIDPANYFPNLSNVNNDSSTS